MVKKKVLNTSKLCVNLPNVLSTFLRFVYFLPTVKLRKLKIPFNSAACGSYVKILNEQSKNVTNELKIGTTRTLNLFCTFQRHYLFVDMWKETVYLS